MTKHSGARKNRKRDLEAHHQHVHAYSEATIAASISLVNASDTFQSSLLSEPTQITTSRMTAYAKAQGVVDQVKMVAFSPHQGAQGIDAKCALVVEMDNVNLASTKYVEKAPPAPASGDPLHWDSFIHRVCERYSERF